MWGSKANPWHPSVGKRNRCGRQLFHNKAPDPLLRRPPKFSFRSGRACSRSRPRRPCLWVARRMALSCLAGRDANGLSARRQTIPTATCAFQTGSQLVLANPASRRHASLHAQRRWRRRLVRLIPCFSLPARSAGFFFMLDFIHGQESRGIACALPKIPPAEL